MIPVEWAGVIGTLAGVIVALVIPFVLEKTKRKYLKKKEELKALRQIQIKTLDLSKVMEKFENDKDNKNLKIGLENWYNEMLRILLDFSGVEFIQHFYLPLEDIMREMVRVPQSYAKEESLTLEIKDNIQKSREEIFKELKKEYDKSKK